MELDCGGGPTPRCGVDVVGESTANGDGGGVLTVTTGSLDDLELEPRGTLIIVGPALVPGGMITTTEPGRPVAAVAARGLVLDGALSGDNDEMSMTGAAG